MVSALSMSARPFCNTDPACKERNCRLKKEEKENRQREDEHMKEMRNKLVI